jgi:hypothetical protein
MAGRLWQRVSVSGWPLYLETGNRRNVLPTGRFGSGCVNPLFKFVAGKRPLKIGFPEAASRQ